MSDEILREVWQIKDAIGKEVNYNLQSLGGLLRKRQQSSDNNQATSNLLIYRQNARE